MAVGHELVVGVEDRVAAEVGRQDVGLGHGDLKPLREEIDVLLDESSIA